MTKCGPDVSPADVEQFRRDGYWICRQPLFPADSFQALQSAFERILAERPAGKRPEELDVPHYAYPELFRWLLSEEVLNLVQPFVGPDIALWSSHFICKPGGTGRAVPWHEDSAYWNGMLEPQEVVTVWLAIDPSDRDNGCMRVIPRTHSHGFSDYEPVDRDTNLFGSRIKPGQFDEGTAVDLELQPDQCHLHHAKLIHGSRPNTSDRRRCGYTMRYMSTRVKFQPRDERMRHQIYLARGRDHAGNTYGDPTARWEQGIR